mmetsp:Transcript_142104/g.250603  ORF Transcript_142104/g.250603 Transcript_142104/m.250603 type:complete len:572 (-) Transcript_142104:113-1828(-)
MYTITLSLVWLACVGQARRVQVTTDQLQASGNPLDDWSQPLMGPAKALTTLLMTSDGPPAGYRVPGQVSSHRVKPRAASASMQKTEAKIVVDQRLLPECALALDVHMPKEIADDIHMKTMDKMSKTAKVPGFRDGKVPPAYLLQHLGKEKCKEATVDNMVKLGLQNSNVEKNYPTIGEARLPVSVEELAKKYTLGDPINFTIEIDFMPTAPVNESKYKGLTVNVPKEPFDQKSYDKALLELKKRYCYKTPLPKGTASEMGNEVKINMNGFYKNPDGSKGAPLPAIAGGDGIDLPLEPGQFMPGLVEGVVGIKEGEERQIEVRFPRRSQNTELANVEAVFDIECLEVLEKTLPEIGDEFANSVRENMTWAEMDERIRETVNQQAEDTTRDRTQQLLQNAVVQTLPEEFTVPGTLIENVAKERFAEMLSMLRDKGTPDDKVKEMVTPENYKIFKKMTSPQIAKDLKGNMAIDAIADQQGLKVDRNKVDEEIMALQAAAVQKKQKFKESEVRPQVEAKLHKDLVFDFLESHATVNMVDPKDVDVSELMGVNPETLAKDMARELQAEEKKKAEAK